MGVDYYPCARCGSTFPDCGSYDRCCYCESMFCGSDCSGMKETVELDGWCDMCGRDDEHKQPCVICRGDFIPDDDLLEYALKKLGMKKKALQEEYRAARRK